MNNYYNSKYIKYYLRLPPDEELLLEEDPEEDPEEEPEELEEPDE